MPAPKYCKEIYDRNGIYEFDVFKDGERIASFMFRVSDGICYNFHISGNLDDGNVAGIKDLIRKRLDPACLGGSLKIERC